MLKRNRTKNHYNLNNARYGFRRSLCCVMAICAISTMILPAFTSGPTEDDKTVQELSCSYTVHQHDESCFNKNGDLICGLADYVVHSHDEDYCYDYEGNLICPLDETEAHEHDDGCFEEMTVLICDLEENENDHQHSEDCYTTESFLVCEEQTLHTHESECYNEDGNLICGLLQLEEHTHAQNCLVQIDDAELDEEVNSEEDSNVDILSTTDTSEQSETETHSDSDAEEEVLATDAELIDEAQEQAADAHLDLETSVSEAEDFGEEENVSNMEIPDDGQGQIDNVIAQIADLPESDDFLSKLLGFEEVGDYDGYNAYLGEIRGIVSGAYSSYLALTDIQQAEVLNAEKLFRLQDILLTLDDTNAEEDDDSSEPLNSIPVSECFVYENEYFHIDFNVEGDATLDLEAGQFSESELSEYAGNLTLVVDVVDGDDEIYNRLTDLDTEEDSEYEKILQVLQAFKYDILLAEQELDLSNCEVTATITLTQTLLDLISDGNTDDVSAGISIDAYGLNEESDLVLIGGYNYDGLDDVSEITVSLSGNNKVFAIKMVATSSWSDNDMDRSLMSTYANSEVSYLTTGLTPTVAIPEEVTTSSDSTAVDCGHLEINQGFASWADWSGEQTFVYHVTATDASGTVVYDNVVANTLSTVDDSAIDVDFDFPTGSVVTVDQVYSGSCYDCYYPASGSITFTISDSGAKYTTSFLAEYDYTYKLGYGLVNSFTVEAGSAEYELPETGGYGVTLLMFLGFACFVSCGLVYIVYRRGRRDVG